MHASSRLKMQAFVDAYGPELVARRAPARVLEVGSKSWEGQDTHRELFAEGAWAYTGLDLEPGRNVDLVPADAYVWTELETASFDAVISAQTFEHNPWFWVTFAEMARVLTPGGLACIIAPGAGLVHRYPLDAWRFYPDAWAGLCAMAGLELVESHFETDALAEVVPGGEWRDCALVARRPELEDPAEESAFRARLEALVAPYRGVAPPSLEPGPRPGKAFEAYASRVRREHPRRPFKLWRRRVKGRGLPGVFEPGDGAG